MLHFTDSNADDVEYNNVIMIVRYWKAICTVANMAWHPVFSAESRRVKLEYLLNRGFIMMFKTGILECSIVCEM
jgi:hypothetical protein